jgi:hypothetical protein
VVGSALIGYLIWAVIAALVVATVVLSVKAAHYKKQVSRERAGRGLREPAYSGSSRRQRTPDVDDELARLKREMGG